MPRLHSNDRGCPSCIDDRSTHVRYDPNRRRGPYETSPRWSQDFEQPWYETAFPRLLAEVYPESGINTRDANAARCIENTEGHHGAQEDGNPRNGGRRSVRQLLAICVLRGLIYQRAPSHRARAQPYLNGYERRKRDPADVLRTKESAAGCYAFGKQNVFVRNHVALAGSCWRAGPAAVLQARNQTSAGGAFWIRTLIHPCVRFLYNGTN